MRKRISVLAVTIAAATLAAAPLVSAHPNRGSGRGIHAAQPPQGGGLFQQLRHLRKALDLSDEQVDKIRVIAAGLREQNAPLRQELRKGHRGPARLLLADPADLAGATSALDKQSGVRQAMRANLLAATSRALAVLTPAQREKLAERMEERAKRQLAD